MKKPIIICVDDERIILDSLRTQLRSYLKQDYNVETAQSGAEALELIDELIEDNEAPYLVISDMIMPQMKGDELLSIVREKCPEALSILLTGQADKNDIIKVINTAGLYRYISKPWDTEDLNITVREALSAYVNSRELEEQRQRLIVNNRELEQKVRERTKKIEEQKEIADKLLMNVLPKEIAEELKEHGRSLPQFYEKVTVLFADLVGFTKIAEKMTPEELVQELDDCFQAFDEILERNHMEKIKTIGDGYMGAGGLPIQNDTNPIDAVKAGLEILTYMNKQNEKRMLQRKRTWQVRIGIHTGELVAGVIGKNKFAYDIWGDTVNLASRMESSGESDKVNISGLTYELVKDNFECIHRGKIQAKSKGDVDMYFVVREFKPN